VLKGWASTWGIATDHFAPYAHAGRHLQRPPIALEAILVEGSNYTRSSLKRRLRAARSSGRAVAARGTAPSGAGTNRTSAAIKASGHLRTVERPSYEQLLTDLGAMPWVAVGAKYGVSNNAVRKWMRRYHAERSEISRPAA